MTTVAYLAPAPGKRAQTKVQNRQMILDAAREAFAQTGYEAATVRDIIRLSGLSVGAFYNYYRSKEEVFAALADDAARRFRPILRAQYEAATDLESYLRGAVSAYLRFAAAESEHWRLRRPAGESVPHMSPTPEIGAVFAQVEADLAQVIERGLAPRVDADYLAASCIGVAREMGEAMLRRRPLDVEGAADFTVRMILGGLPALPRL